MPAQWGSMAATVEASPLKYTSVFGSTVPRFSAKYYGASVRTARRRLRAAAPPTDPSRAAQACKEEVYDINHAHKADLVTSVQRSPLKLSHMRPGRPRMTVRARPESSRPRAATGVALRSLTAAALRSTPSPTRARRSTPTSRTSAPWWICCRTCPSTTRSCAPKRSGSRAGGRTSPRCAPAARPKPRPR